jgi:hypothetical protein
MGSLNWLLRPGKACRLRFSRSRAGERKGWLRLSISKDHYKSSIPLQHPDKDR